MSTQPTPGILGYCRICGIALTEANVVNAQGTIYCKEHAPMSTTGIPFGAAPQGPPPGPPQSPYTAPPSPYSAPPGYPMPPQMANPNVSPGVAFLLGAIPGVGAIYNGQYGKGLMHVVIVGLLISVTSNSATSNGLEPLFGLMIAAFWFYMCFEAYHTARLRQMGQPVDEFSSLLPIKGGSSFPFAPILLIVLGTVFLLSNLELLELRKVLRFWPAILIALGVYMLYARYATGDKSDVSVKDQTL
jgi:hypothetical protein